MILRRADRFRCKDIELLGAKSLRGTFEVAEELNENLFAVFWDPFFKGYSLAQANPLGAIVDALDAELVHFSDEQVYRIAADIGGRVHLAHALRLAVGGFR